MSSMMMSMNDDGWSTVASASAKKGSKRAGIPVAHTAMAPRLSPASQTSKSRATKLTFSQMQEELETAAHVAITVAPSAREIRKEAARAAEKAAPTATNSYVQFPTLSSSSASSTPVGQKPKLDFRAVAVAAAAKATPTPPNPPVAAAAAETLPFILRSTVPVGADRIVWVEEGYTDSYGYEFDETAYDMEPLEYEDEEEYITDDRAAFNARRYGDNSDW